jgi:alpha-amylase
MASYKASFADLSVLGTFIDNHDHQRFLNYNNDHVAYKNALTYVITAIGIPIIYYGTEQGFAGGNDPDNREPLWTSGYSTNTDLYTHIKTLVAFRYVI